MMDDVIMRGSQIAKNGFKNERNIADKFNNWTKDDDAKEWLLIMNYCLDDIEWVKAIVLPKCKADLNV